MRPLRPVSSVLRGTYTRCLFSIAVSKSTPQNLVEQKSLPPRTQQLRYTNHLAPQPTWHRSWLIPELQPPVDSFLDTTKRPFLAIRFVSTLYRLYRRHRIEDPVRSVSIVVEFSVLWYLYLYYNRAPGPHLSSPVITKSGRRRPLPARRCVAWEALREKRPIRGEVTWITQFRSPPPARLARVFRNYTTYDVLFLYALAFALSLTLFVPSGCPVLSGMSFSHQRHADHGASCGVGGLTDPGQCRVRDVEDTKRSSHHRRSALTKRTLENIRSAQVRTCSLLLCTRTHSLDGNGSDIVQAPADGLDRYGNSLATAPEAGTPPTTCDYLPMTIDLISAVHGSSK